MEKRVAPVKRFVAMLWRDADARDEAIRRLVESFGPCDLVGDAHTFDQTDYYSAEMGHPLLRRIVAFERLCMPDELAAAKLACVELERALSRQGCRRANLDVGYLDHAKIVLASIKGAGQKIYLRDGVYADLVARFRHGRYEPFEWTFPDLRAGNYERELMWLRRRYLEQLRKEDPA